MLFQVEVTGSFKLEQPVPGYWQQVAPGVRGKVRVLDRSVAILESQTEVFRGVWTGRCRRNSRKGAADSAFLNWGRTVFAAGLAGGDFPGSATDHPGLADMAAGAFVHENVLEVCALTLMARPAEVYEGMGVRAASQLASWRRMAA